MKMRLVLMVGTLLASAASANAGFGVSVSYNAPVAYGGCYAPAPVVYGEYYAPPVYYVQPAPVVYRSYHSPAYYPQRTVVYRGHGRRYGRGCW